MPAVDTRNARIEPPARALKREALPLEQSPSLKDLIGTRDESASLMAAVLCGRVRSQKQRADLTYRPQVFQRLSQLPDNWDGLGSRKPSNELLQEGENLWSFFEELFPELDEPRIVVGSGGHFLTFSWCSENRQLLISLYEADEDKQSFVDWVLELNGVEVSDSACISEAYDSLFRRLSEYASVLG